MNQPEQPREPDVVEEYKFRSVICVVVTLSCGHMFSDTGNHHWKIDTVVACPQCNRLKP